MTNQPSYAVDIYNPTSKSYEPITATNLTFDQALSKAESLYQDDKSVRIMGWTQEDGFMEVAHFGLIY